MLIQRWLARKRSFGLVVRCGLLLGSLAPACRRQQPSTSRQTAVVAADSTLGAPAADSTAHMAARFAQRFYDWYARQGERFDVAVRDSPAFFALQLLRDIRADVEASARSPGEIVGLDWDPFLGTQDPCNPYRVGETTRRGDTVLVPVKGMCTDRNPTPGPDVIAELRFENGRWTFVDFRHVGDAGSLVHDLAKLREARQSKAVK
jgi:hypothetical protein